MRFISHAMFWFGCIWVCIAVAVFLISGEVAIEAAQLAGLASIAFLLMAIYLRGER